jgi:hypothetical protein
VPSGQIEQAPYAQKLPFWHAFPQEPQLKASCEVSTHSPLQSVCVPVHVGLVQLPFEQTGVSPLQTTPQPPQSDVLLTVSVHSPPHIAWPWGHDDWHTPPWHVALAPPDP